MKKISTLFFVSFAGLISLHAEIISHVQIGDLYYNLDTDAQTAEVTYKERFPENDSMIVANIPSSVEYNAQTYPVTGIGEYAFNSCMNLTTVTIPNTVTTIGNAAFFLCRSLKSISIPNSVVNIGNSVFSSCDSLPIINNIRYADTYLVEAIDKTLLSYTIQEGTRWIGNSAFSWCENMTSIIIPDGIISIGSYAFNCTNLTSINIPNTVTDIEEYAFSHCRSLASISVPNSVTNIGKFAFESCRSLNEPIYNTHIFAFLPTSYSGAYSIPEGIEYIAGGAFNACMNLTSITIPNSVTNIGDQAFGYCRSITSFSIPNSVTYIGNDAFWSCDGLTEPVYNAHVFAYLPPSYLDTAYTIPEGIESIAGSAFMYSEQLTSVTLPNSLTYIGENAFFYCKLTSITIPKNVTYIGVSAFNRCDSLTSVTCLAAIPPTMGYDYSMNISVFGGKYPDGYHMTLYVPAESIDLYKAADQWKDFNPIIGIDAPEEHEAVENTSVLPAASTTKLLHNGQILIRRADRTFTLTGTEVK